MYQASVYGPMPANPIPVQNGPVSKLIPINWVCQKDGKFRSHQAPIQWISGLPMQASIFAYGDLDQERIYAEISCALPRTNWHCLMQVGVKITSINGEHLMDSVIDLPTRIIGQSQINKCSLFLFNWDEETRLEYAPNGIMNATVSIHFLESFGGLSSAQLPTQENQNNDLAMVNQQIEIDRLRAQIGEINRALAQKDKERDQYVAKISCLEASLNQYKEAHARAQEELRKLRLRSHIKLEDVS